MTTESDKDTDAEHGANKVKAEKILKELRELEKHMKEVNKVWDEDMKKL